MIYILTGTIHSGKTTFLKKIVYELKEQKFKIDGFLSEAILKNQKIIGYDMFDLKEEKSVPFIRRKGEKEWEKIGPYFFMPSALARAEKIILRGQEVDILVVDEVGPLELVGKGLWPVLNQVIFKPLTKYLFVVRVDILEKFLGMLSGTKIKIFDIKNKGVFSQLTKEIKKVA